MELVEYTTFLELAHSAAVENVLAANGVTLRQKS
jgi:hypothetical protein